MNRAQRRAQDAYVQNKAKEFQTLTSGGWGVGNAGSIPATGQRPAVNPFLLPKSSGLNVTSKTYPFNYFVEWNLSTWRTACDQAMKMGYTIQYATMTQWVYECSPFVQSLFNAIYTGVGSINFEISDSKGNKNIQWTNEICGSNWFKLLVKEISVSDMWGFTGLNFDPINNKTYKYPIADIDPISRMLRASSYSFFDGINFDKNDNLLFVQPSTNYEEFLGKMQTIARSFIQMNLMSNNWVAAGRRLAFPIMTVGYPQGDGGISNDTLLEQYNPHKIQAQNILENIDPQNGVIYPYTISPDGTIQKAIDISFQQTGTSSTAYKIFSDFNKEQKDEIRELVLGGTLSSNSGDKGARSLGEVHERKFETVIKDKINYILTVLNNKEDFLLKIPKFYKNFPKDANFTVNLAKEYSIEEVVSYSDALNKNGKRLTTQFFIANGLNPEFIEDAPIEIPKEETTKTQLELHTGTNVFGLKKKLVLAANI